MLRGVIYKITNTINGKTYIGQSIQPKKRKHDHFCQKNTSCKALKHSMIKYGRDNFEFELLCSAKKEHLNDLEIYFIDYFKSFGKNGYNLTPGGKNGTADMAAKTVIGYDIKTGKTVEIFGINRAGQFGFDPRSITRAIKGEYSQFKGYLWFYESEYNLSSLKNRLIELKKKCDNFHNKGIHLVNKTRLIRLLEG